MKASTLPFLNWRLRSLAMFYLQQKVTPQTYEILIKPLFSTQDSTIICVLEEMIVSLIKFEEKTAQHAAIVNVFKLEWTWKVTWIPE